MKELKLVVEIQNDDTVEELTLEVKGANMTLKIGDQEIGIMATEPNVRTLVQAIRAACSAGRDMAMASNGIVAPAVPCANQYPGMPANSGVVAPPFWQAQF